MGLSGSSSGFSTGSWYISIEEYSLRWMFHGIGTRGSTGGWTGDSIGSCIVASLGSLLGGNGSRTGSGLARGFGVDAEGYKAVSLLSFLKYMARVLVLNFPELHFHLLSKAVKSLIANLRTSFLSFSLRLCAFCLCNCKEDFVVKKSCVSVLAGSVAVVFFCLCVRSLFASRIQSGSAGSGVEWAVFS